MSCRRAECPCHVRFRHERAPAEPPCVSPKCSQPTCSLRFVLGIKVKTPPTGSLLKVHISTFYESSSALACAGSGGGDASSAFAFVEQPDPRPPLRGVAAGADCRLLSRCRARWATDV